MGSLYKQHTKTAAVPPNLLLDASAAAASSANDSSSSSTSFPSMTSLAHALDSNERPKSLDYCVLIGNTLTSFYDRASYLRGDHPTSEVRIVGASAWNPPSVSTKTMSVSASASLKSVSSSPSLSSALVGQPSPVSATLASEMAVTAAASSAVVAAASAGGSSTHGRIQSPLSTPMSTGTRSASSASATSPTSSPAVKTTTVTTTTTTSLTGPPTFRLVTYAGTHIYASAPSAADRDTWLAALHSGLEASYASPYSDGNNDDIDDKDGSSATLRGGNVGSGGKKKFAEALAAVGNVDDRILTPPPAQRGTRLRAALKRRVSASNTQNVPSHGYRNPYEIDAPPSSRHCTSCGRYPPEPSMKANSAPLPQYGIESRANLCQDCLISQGVLRHVKDLTGLLGSDAHERAALTSARDLVVKTVEEMARRERIAREKRAVAEEEARIASLEQDRAIARAFGRAVQEAAAGQEQERHQEEGDEDSGGSGGTIVSSAGTAVTANSGGSGGGAMADSWTNVDESTSGTHFGSGNSGGTNGTLEDETTAQTSSTLSGSWTNIEQPPGGSSGATGGTPSRSSRLANSGMTSASASSNPWVNLPPTAASTRAILDLISTPDFAAHRHRSRSLDLNCRMLESGTIGCTAEFVEVLEECAREASPASTADGGGGTGEGEEGEEIAKMKREALRVAGDMGAAIKLLHEHALPHGSGANVAGSSRKSANSVPPSNTSVAAGMIAGSSASSTHTEMLQCILEFFLDLCDDGEIKSLAFFWPQLRSIHLRMLPPVDADALVKVELMEDFLLTVSARYSVHLALELVWGCVADLEESLSASGPFSCPGPIRRRRFAVLRFVCELESLLFDFDGGWGGGSVSLRGMLAPSQHQAMLIRDAVSALQVHRRFGSHRLSRSVRLDKLMGEAEAATEPKEENMPKLPPGIKLARTKSSQEKALHAFRIAKNADYFSSQLMFTRRLGDIAERLRFMDVDKRASALEAELDVLNSSGRMGGDPLNKLICTKGGGDSGLATVVHVPSGEGHVFRSKERTPVLLLMELIREGGEEEEAVGEEQAAKNEEVVGEGHSTEDPAVSAIGTESETKVDEIEEGIAAESAATSAVSDTAEEKDNDALPSPGPRPLTPPPSSAPPSRDCASTEAALPGTSLNISGSSSIFPTRSPVRERSATWDPEGSGSMAIPPSPRCALTPLGKLKRFDSPSTDSTARNKIKIDDESGVTPDNRGRMENLVADMMRNSLDLPVLGTDDHDEGQKEVMEEEEKFEDALSEEEETQDEPPSPAAEPLSVDEKGGAVEGETDTENVHDTDDSGMAAQAISRAGQPPELKETSPAKLETVATSSSSSSRSPPSAFSAGGNARRTRQSRAVVAASQSKMSAFGPFSSSSAIADSGDEKFSSSMAGLTSSGKPPLAAFGEVRREVLTTIMMKGMRGSNIIARGAAPVAQRIVQAMDRQRAVELIMNGKTTNAIEGDGGAGNNDAGIEDVDSRSKGLQSRSGSIGDGGASTASDSTSAIDTDNNLMMSPPSEEDEAIEALRLLLIQNRVAQGNLTPENAAKALAPDHPQSKGVATSMESIKGADDRGEVVDAADVDPRLAGCGPLSHAVLSALRMWREGIVSNAEVLELVHKDLQFLRHSALPGDENKTKLAEDSAFWGRFAFGERWAEKKARIAASSPHGCLQGWDLAGVIIKSNDDLRQEAFVMQLIELCQEAFEMAGLELWVQPYCILATGRTTGIIEMVRNAMSFDSLKKRPGYGKGGLRGHLKRMTEYEADPEEAFRTAQRNFVRSLAAYSLLSYLFLFKDRHNGNILLDTAGHVIHIDFGFVFGIAPGGSFSLEQSAPFKLTEEMIQVMGGLKSPLFSEFVILFCCGFLALQAHADTFLTIVEITCIGSNFNCFEGKSPREVVSKLRDRFSPHLNKEETVQFALDLIKSAVSSYGTKQYDYFQYLSQGIAS